MQKMSEVCSYITALYGLVFVKEIVGLIVLILSLLNILFNMFIRIRQHIKAKNYTGVSQDFKDTIEELKNLTNKEEE